MRGVDALKAVLVALFVIVAVSAHGSPVAPAAYEGAAAAIVDDKGNMRVPTEYRTTYQLLGSWVVAAADGSGPESMHVVYASPGSIAAYRAAGHFPDGSILVKEVFKTETQSMTTGEVSRADSLVGWFVMVKDSVGRFPENKLWGDGWGWAWFDAADSKKATSMDYKADCLGCHVPAKESDWIYSNGYPPLKK